VTGSRRAQHFDERRFWSVRIEQIVAVVHARRALRRRVKPEVGARVLLEERAMREQRLAHDAGAQPRTLVAAGLRAAATRVQHP
jgi:hypothetical protein